MPLYLVQNAGDDYCGGSRLFDSLDAARAWLSKPDATLVEWRSEYLNMRGRRVWEPDLSWHVRVTELEVEA
jgi:hypothetical protein